MYNVVDLQNKSHLPFRDNSHAAWSEAKRYAVLETNQSQSKNIQISSDLSPPLLTIKAKHVETSRRF